MLRIQQRRVEAVERIKEDKMQYPKLNPRPEAKMVCTAFRGLDRRPGASNRSYNKSWQWSWHDERNLSSDRFPRLSVRKARGTAIIDGNQPADQIIGMCGGDHALLLDAGGNLWCNGHSIYLAGDSGVEYSWSVSGFSVTPSSANTGFDPTGDDIQSVLWDAWEGHWGRATLVYDPAGAPGSSRWHWIERDLWTNLTALGLIAGAVPRQGDSFTVTFETSCYRFGEVPQIVRIGAYAVIYPGWVWCNAVKLAAGDTMTEGEDYGVCEGFVLSNSGTLTLSLCDKEGNAYSGVVVQSSEPAHSGYWLNTDGDKPELLEWSVVQTSWVSVTSTWVKIETLSNQSGLDTIRKGDGVTISADCSSGTDAGVVELLNKEHYIYDANIDENSGGWIMVAGILPASTVTVTLNANKLCRVSRSLPEMDFLVEAQNRLWGCRYSEADNINEIYASKLGDFRNWHVFQGLSTDSWTASRGTAAPFTGAVTLGGNPLFFREDWLEKVFPSSSGAHQIQTYSLEGVQQGASRSMVIIDERLYYKSRMGICVYSGTLPARISEEFGEWTFNSGSPTAARHKRKYVINLCLDTSAQPGMTAPKWMVGVYDLETGDWHMENESWDGAAVTWNDVCYYVKDGEVYAFDSGPGSAGVEWFAESDEMSLELPEHKWVKTLRLRYVLELGASFRVYVSYDGGPWERKADLHGNRLHSAEAEIWPRRCDHFRLRLEGKGGCEVQSISYRVERSQGGR